MTLDLELIRRHQERFKKENQTIAKCPYCKNMVDLATGERVPAATPAGMLTCKVCNQCLYIVEAEMNQERGNA